MFNPNVCDAKRLCMFKPNGLRSGHCLGYTKYPLGHPRYEVTDARVVQFVTLGVVSQSSVLAATDKRKSKFLRAFVPSYTTDRIQGLIRVGMRQMSGDVRCQITTMGFEFATRGTSFHSSLLEKGLTH